MFKCANARAYRVGNSHTSRSVVTAVGMHAAASAKLGAPSSAAGAGSDDADVDDNDDDNVSPAPSRGNSSAGSHEIAVLECTRTHGAVSGRASTMRSARALPGTRTNAPTPTNKYSRCGLTSSDALEL